MKARWWRFVAALTHSSSVRLGPLVRRGGALQAWLFRRTGGRVQGKFFGAPILVLEVRGRKSGAVRVAPLLYVEDGGNYVVLAANGGNAKAPAWWLNLRDAGEGVAVFRGGRRVPVGARLATADERPRMWRALAANYPPVERYATFTTRELPVVVLEPR